MIQIIFNIALKKTINNIKLNVLVKMKLIELEKKRFVLKMVTRFVFECCFISVTRTALRSPNTSSIYFTHKKKKVICLNYK